MLRHALAASLLLLVGCAEPGEGGDDDNAIEDPGITDCDQTGTALGDCAEDFTLKSADGADVTLSAYAGQRVILIGAAEW